MCKNITIDGCTTEFIILTLQAFSSLLLNQRITLFSASQWVGEEVGFNLLQGGI